MISTKTDAALADKAIKIATKAVAEYTNRNGIIIGDDGLDRMLGLLQIEVQEALPIACEDAKSAIAANMGQVAEATFTATMRIAGINAAKRFAGE